QGMARQAERGRRLLEVAARLRQRLPDQSALEGFGGGVVVASAGRRGGHHAASAARYRAQDAVGQVARQDLVVLLEDEDALQQVLLLARVAGPGRAQDDGRGLRAETAQAAAIGPVEPADEMARQREHVVAAV